MYQSPCALTRSATLSFNLIPEANQVGRQAAPPPSNMDPFDSGSDDGDDGFETYELTGSGPNAVPDTDTGNQVSTMIDYQAGSADDETGDHDDSDDSSSTSGRTGRPGGGEPLRGGPPRGRLLTGSGPFYLEEDDGEDCETNGAGDDRYDNVSDSEDEPKWASEHCRTSCRPDWARLHQKSYWRKQRIRYLRSQARQQRKETLELRRKLREAEAKLQSKLSKCGKHTEIVCCLSFPAFE